MTCGSVATVRHSNCGDSIHRSCTIPLYTVVGSTHAHINCGVGTRCRNGGRQELSRMLNLLPPTANASIYLPGSALAVRRARQQMMVHAPRSQRL